jgi:hypothetical protein
MADEKAYYYNGGTIRSFASEEFSSDADALVWAEERRNKLQSPTAILFTNEDYDVYTSETFPDVKRSKYRVVKEWTTAPGEEAAAQVLVTGDAEYYVYVEANTEKEALEIALKSVLWRRTMNLPLKNVQAHMLKDKVETNVEKAVALANGLTPAEKLEIACQILGCGTETDNHGQIILYTEMKRDGDIVRDMTAEDFGEDDDDA